MEEAAPLQTNHAEDGLAENAGVHFACTEHTVYKNDRHFYYLEPVFVCRELHLNLEGIALEPYFVKVHSLEHLATIANEARRGIVNGNAGDNPHIFGGVVRHEDTPHGPVDHVYTCHISRAYDHIGAFVDCRLAKAEQVGGVMRKIGGSLLYMQSPDRACRHAR